MSPIKIPKMNDMTTRFDEISHIRNLDSPKEWINRDDSLFAILENTCTPEWKLNRDTLKDKNIIDTKIQKFSKETPPKEKPLNNNLNLLIENRFIKKDTC